MSPEKVRKKGFTLIELIIVVVVISILAAFAMPAYLGARRRTIVREAQANAAIIAKAEFAYYIDNGCYLPCADTAAINQNLDLSIPLQGTWKYYVPRVGANAIDDCQVNIDPINFAGEFAESRTTVPCRNNVVASVPVPEG
jgi:prepilin-type N-terminal cleavage/methylation domain-containing protein